MIRKILIAVFTAAAFIAGPGLGAASAGVAISPAYIELKLDKGRPAGTFLIKNTGNVEERFRINSVHFEINENGVYAITPPESDQLGAWIKFNPKELILPPLSERKVRFVVAPRSKLENGQYRAAMELESLKINKSTIESEGRTVELNTLSSILVPIFASYGEIKYQAQPKGIKLIRRKDRNFVTGAIENTGMGNLVVDAHYVITDTAGNIIDEGRLGRNHVLPGKLRVFSTPAPEDLQNGKYTIHVDYEIDKLEGNLTEEAEVSLDM